jgi:hypothetical protein
MKSPAKITKSDTKPCTLALNMHDYVSLSAIKDHHHTLEHGPTEQEPSAQRTAYQPTTQCHSQDVKMTLPWPRGGRNRPRATPSSPAVTTDDVECGLILFALSVEKIPCRLSVPNDVYPWRRCLMIGVSDTSACSLRREVHADVSLSAIMTPGGAPHDPRTPTPNAATGMRPHDHPTPDTQNDRPTHGVILAWPWVDGHRVINFKVCWNVS